MGDNVPLIGFTVCKAEILSGEKRQTIRKARKIPIKEGDTLYLYWHLRQRDCELLRVEKCTSMTRISWGLIKDNEAIAKDDGFKDAAEMRVWFQKKHKPKDSDLFDIIKW